MIQDRPIVTMERRQDAYAIMLIPMTLSDLECIGEIFNDTKHRAVSLRQLSFLLGKNVDDISKENISCANFRFIDWQIHTCIYTTKCTCCAAPYFVGHMLNHLYI